VQKRSDVYIFFCEKGDRNTDRRGRACSLTLEREKHLTVEICERSVNTATWLGAGRPGFRFQQGQKSLHRVWTDSPANLDSHPLGAWGCSGRSVKLNIHFYLVLRLNAWSHTSTLEQAVLELAQGHVLQRQREKNSPPPPKHIFARYSVVMMNLQQTQHGRL
jgi:hypothetical protein